MSPADASSDAVSGWRLWLDWCLAHGWTDPSDTAVTRERFEAFQAEVASGASKIRRERATSRRSVKVHARARKPKSQPVYDQIRLIGGWRRDHKGHWWAPGEDGYPVAGRTDPWAEADGFLRPLDLSIEDCPVAGPQGFRGRRDAFLLVLTRGCRMSRTEALRVVPGDITVEGDQILVRRGATLDPVEVPRDQWPLACQRCAIVRWIELVYDINVWAPTTSATGSEWSVGVRNILARAEEAPTRHACADLHRLARWLDALVPVDDGQGGRREVVLLPAINRYLQAETREPMSIQAVTAAIARRCEPLLEEPTRKPLAVDNEAERPEWMDDVSEVDDDEFDEETVGVRLQSACEAADVANQAFSAFLDDPEKALEAWRARQP